MRLAGGFVGLVALMTIPSVGCSSSSEPAVAPEPPAAEVTCAPARRKEVTDQVVLRGVVRAPPNRDAVVSAAVPGRIVSVKVTEGDPVKAGDALATIDDPQLASAEAQAQAALQSAQAVLEAARQTLDREKKLYAEGIAAQRDVQDAQSKAASAQADVTTARSKVQLAKEQRARARVQAPIAGTVIRVMRRAGELVDGTPSTPIAEVADTSVLELSSDVPASELVRLSEGQSAEVTLDAIADHPIPGAIVRIAPTVDTATSLGKVRIELHPSEADAGHLHIGMAGQALIHTGKRSALVVPEQAVRESSDGQDEVVVCRHGADGTTASVRRVQVGLHTDGEVEIAKGLSGGEEVVADHVLGLDDGEKLRPQKGSHP